MTDDNVIRKVRDMVQSLLIDKSDPVGGWLRRAEVNAKVARLIVDQRNTELYVEAVTQVQQSAEKAVKALLIKQGVPYQDVKDLEHNAIAAFLTLFRNSTNLQEAKNIWQAKITVEDVRNINNLINVSISRKAQRGKIRKAIRDLLPQVNQEISIGKNTDWRDWYDRARKCPPDRIYELFKGYQVNKGILFDYANLINPERRADPTPLLLGHIAPIDWGFSPDYGGLPEWFQGKSMRKGQSPEIRAAVESLCEYLRTQLPSHIHSGQSMDTVNMREFVRTFASRSSNWIRLYLIGAITTPHAVSSRYPSAPDDGSIGAQHYDSGLGIVKCIPMLASEMEDTVRILIEEHEEKRSSSPSA